MSETRKKQRTPKREIFSWAGVFGVIGLDVLKAQYGLQNAILFCAVLLSWLF